MGVLGIAMSFSFLAGGALAQSLHRIHMMVGSDLSRAIATMAFVVGPIVLHGPSEVWIVAVASLINGVAVGFFRPAEASLWPEIVPSDDLQKTLATNALLSRSGLIVGTSLGGLLIAIKDAQLGLLIDSGTFVLSAIILWGCSDSTRQRSASMASVLRTSIRAWNIPGNLRETFRLAGRYRWLRRLLVGSNLFSLAQAAAGIVLPVYLISKFSSTAVGVYQAMPSFCLIGGSLLARNVRFRMPGLIYALGPCSMAVAWILAAVLNTSAVPIAVLGVGFVCQSWAEPMWAKALADGYLSSERARMFAAMQASSLTLAPLGAVVAGSLLAIGSTGTSVIVLGAFGALTALLPLTVRGSLRMPTVKVHQDA